MNGAAAAVIAAILLVLACLDPAPAGQARTCIPKDGWVRICR